MLLFAAKTNLTYPLWVVNVYGILLEVHLVKAMVFPVVMYGCESWTIKNTEELILLNCGVGEDF